VKKYIYDTFRYLFPPRPESKTPPETLDRFEEMGMVGQAKLNGSCSVLFTNGKQVFFYNRHKEQFKNKLLIDKEELARLHRGEGWMVLVGEYMNKSQRDINNNLFNGKFVIWDILVFNGLQLVGMDLDKRLNLLANMYDTTSYDPYIRRISANCFIVETFTENFKILWQNIVKIEMYEGWVLKRPSAKLEDGNRVANNVHWQLKCRKETKNYGY